MKWMYDDASESRRIDVDRYSLTSKQRQSIAERLAAERLADVNRKCSYVNLKRCDSFYAKYVKRILDIVFSIVALIVTFPINLLIGIITFFDVGRPIFFSQERIGKDGKVFKIVKFRNMTNAVDSSGNLLPAAQRVTKWGSFVRKTSLDELLNFWSVLKGDMSIIGPRPLVLSYAQRFNVRHAQRCAVRPGLECPPRSTKLSLRSWQDQFENDIWYVENISFLTDCRMLYCLVRFMLDRRNSSARASVRSTFVGYAPDGTAISLTYVPQSYIDALEPHDSANSGANDTFVQNAS